MKRLIDFNDFFADVVNGFIFQGEQVVSPDKLKDVKEDVFPYEGHRSLKLWTGRDNIPSQFAVYFAGYDADIDKEIAVQVMSYEAAFYDSQIGKNKPGEYVPITTMRCLLLL